MIEYCEKRDFIVAPKKKKRLISVLCDSLMVINRECLNKVYEYYNCAFNDVKNISRYISKHQLIAINCIRKSEKRARLISVLHISFMEIQDDDWIIRLENNRKLKRTHPKKTHFLLFTLLSLWTI